MQEWLARWSSAALLLLVCACGGGGGGGDNSPSGVALKLSPPQMEATVQTGTNGVVAVTGTIDPSVVTGPLYVGLVDPQGIFTNSFDIDPISATVATLRFHTATTGIAAGVYKGTLRVYLCKDYYCNSQYAGSPLEVPYNITVAATAMAATLNPSNISASTEAGVSAQAVLSAQVGAEAGATPQFAVQDLAGVFTPNVVATPVGGSDYQLTITMGVVNAPSTYTGTIRLSVCASACNGTNDVSGSPIPIPYTVVVTSPATPALTLTPRSINLSTGTDVQVQALLSGVVGPQAGSTPQFAVQDSADRFRPTIRATLVSGSNYELTVTMGAVNTPGTYTGTLRVSVCSVACSGFNGVAGSPVSLPYTVVVAAPAPLQPVLTPSGLPEWETHQGNAAHTGFVPVSLNPNLFSVRWSRDLGVNLNPATVSNGKVIVSTPARFGPASLIALRETDGSQVWSHSFGTVPALNPPAAYGGRVFVATSGHSDTFLWSFNADDGTQLFKSPFNAQWEHYLAPTLLDGDVCFNGGSFGGLYCAHASTGAHKWFSSLGQYDLWTPALNQTYAFGYTGRQFSAILRSNGALAFKVSDPAFNWGGNGYSINAAPVIASDDSVLVVNGTGSSFTGTSNHVIRYSISGQSESWRVGGSFLNDPVVAVGKFYLSNEVGNQLEARDEQTGSLLWTWKPPSGETLSKGNLILVNNLVFVGTSTGTYAVDLTTHQAVWSVARPGKLALSSNRLLYIVGNSGRVDAYNLY